jgi:hypothetical protein
MAIYASMGVAEAWRYDGRHNQMHIYHLKDGAYVEVANSIAFPILTSATLSEFLEQSNTKGQTATLRALRQWVRQNSKSR